MSDRTLVLLGIGHTHLHVVDQWRQAPLASGRLICISQFPTAAYSGMLPGVVSGQFDPAEMQIDLRALTRRAGAELVLGEVTELDRANQMLRFHSRPPIQYDLLSIDVGSIPAGSRSIQDPSIVSVKPMQTFWDRLQPLLVASACSSGKTTSKRRIAVVGGGAAGIELAICLARRVEATRSRVEIILFEGSERIAGGMHDRAARKLERLLGDRGVSLRTRERIQRVESGRLTTDRGADLAVDCVVWATGPSPPVLLESLDLQHDAAGFLAVRPTLRTVSDPKVFAVGDCATMIDDPVAKAGVFAVRQGPVLWQNLRSSWQGQNLKDFKPQRRFLKLLNTGCDDALLEYGPVVLHGRLFWKWKAWIDRGFVRQYQAEKE